MCFKERLGRTHSSFNKLTINHIEYGNGGIVHTASEISEKYTEARPANNKSSVKGRSAKGFTR